MGVNVAIDGPSGAGKSTVAKAAAKELGYIYVDTGAMYRAIGLYMLNHGIPIEDEAKVSAALPMVNVTIRYEEGTQQVILNGENVSPVIRTQAVSDAASVTSAYAPVRQKLLDLQHSLARENDVIMDGRDIGTAILPNAEVKIYLTASTYVRAQRRFAEMAAKGQECDLKQVMADIEERDYRDSHREVSPLTQAADAVYLDTSELDIDGAVNAAIEIIHAKLVLAKYRTPEA